MRIEELTAVPWQRETAGAPDWLTGCFKRRSITFFTGVTDRSTLVYWLQTRGLSADFRVAPSRPVLSERSSLQECDATELAALLTSEGGLSQTRWDGEVMTWWDWTSFQIHDKWTEVGRLHRVGDCLIEIAPSGAYVEDWRLLDSAEGPLIGLSLREERNLTTGKSLERRGGVIVCGDHAAFVRSRPPGSSVAGRLSDLVRGGDKPAESLIDEIFSCEASYARRSSPQSPYVVLLSTNPLREGKELFEPDGFSYDPATRLVTQQIEIEGALLERVFTVDTLESCRAGRVTLTTQEARDWLARESDTLLAYAESPHEDTSTDRLGIRNAAYDVYNRSRNSSLS